MKGIILQFLYPHCAHCHVVGEPARIHNLPKLNHPKWSKSSVRKYSWRAYLSCLSSSWNLMITSVWLETLPIAKYSSTRSHEDRKQSKYTGLLNIQPSIIEHLKSKPDHTIIKLNVIGETLIVNSMRMTNKIKGITYLINSLHCHRTHVVPIPSLGIWKTNSNKSLEKHSYERWIGHKIESMSLTYLHITHSCFVCLVFPGHSVLLG